MASSQNKIALKYMTRIDFAGSSLTTSYQAVSAPLPYPIRIIKFKNLTNQTIDLSTDGVTDMDVFAATSGDVTDGTANRNTHEGTMFPANTQFYVKAAGGSGTGTFSIVGLYT